MIKLRELKEKDAPLMLEWMHNGETQHSFKCNMLKCTLEEAIDFCNNASIPETVEPSQSLHFAIVDDADDEYIGTISLKNIDLINQHAEYAIALRKKYRGMGIALEASKLLIAKAFNEYKLHRVFLTVLGSNDKAKKLYEKCGFRYEGCLKQHIYAEGHFLDWHMYGIVKDE